MITKKKLTENFKYNESLDSLLYELKELLRPIQIKVEKRFEEILLDEEGVDKTRHKKIFIGKLTGKPYDELMVQIE